MFNTVRQLQDFRECQGVAVHTCCVPKMTPAAPDTVWTVDISYMSKEQRMARGDSDLHEAVTRLTCAVDFGVHWPWLKESTRLRLRY